MSFPNIQNKTFPVIGAVHIGSEERLLEILKLSHQAMELQPEMLCHQQVCSAVRLIAKEGLISEKEKNQCLEDIREALDDLVSLDNYLQYAQESEAHILFKGVLTPVEHLPSLDLRLSWTSELIAFYEQKLVKDAELLAA